MDGFWLLVMVASVLWSQEAWFWYWRWVRDDDEFELGVRSRLAAEDAVARRWEDRRREDEWEREAVERMGGSAGVIYRMNRGRSSKAC